MIKYTGLAFLPLLDDTVEMMLHSVDQYTSSLPIFVFMRILHSIVGVLHKIAVQERNERQSQPTPPSSVEEGKEKSEPQARSKLSIEEIRKYFKDHHERKEKEKQERERQPKEEEPEVIEREEEEEPEPEKKPKKDTFNTQITRRQRLFVKHIIEKSRHFVGSAMRELKLLVLDILQQYFSYF